MQTRPPGEWLEEIVRRIVETVHPNRILLFGSSARGEANEHSDLDLLIVVPSDLPRHRRSIPIYRALSDVPIPMDILVYTPDEIRDWANVPQAFVTTAVREGRVLYEVAA